MGVCNTPCSFKSRLVRGLRENSRKWRKWALPSWDESWTTRGGADESWSGLVGPIHTWWNSQKPRTPTMSRVTIRWASHESWLGLVRGLTRAKSPRLDWRVKPRLVRSATTRQEESWGWSPETLVAGQLDDSSSRVVEPTTSRQNDSWSLVQRPEVCRPIGRLDPRVVEPLTSRHNDSWVQSPEATFCRPWPTTQDHESCFEQRLVGRVMVGQRQ